MLATHALLQACWWGALRWVARGALPWTGCAAALAVATGCFAALLAPRVDVPLGVWAALFTPPWMLRCARAAGVLPGAGAGRASTPRAVL